MIDVVVMRKSLCAGVATAMLSSCSGSNLTSSTIPQTAPEISSNASPRAPDAVARHVRYRFVDLGTFGGPSSYFTATGPEALADNGMATGNADTSMPDPLAPLCFVPECFVTEAFITKGSGLTNLGSLPGGDGSIPAAVTSGATAAVDVVHGTKIDPLSGLPDLHAAIWSHGSLTDLGTFGGTFSYVNEMNNAGDLTGFATNTVPDPFPLGNDCQNFPLGAQMRAYISHGTHLQNLGTLGGPDSCGVVVNNSGDVAGQSYTNAVANITTGFPTEHPFLWKNGAMRDIGSLGGTVATVTGVNDRGEVAGTSLLAGDTNVHPFLWNGGTPHDLGTLGGPNGEANGLGISGEVVGAADISGAAAIHHAFLWSDGTMKDLGTQDGDPCSRALAINSLGQITGASSDCSNARHGFLWQRGAMIDLNLFVPAGSRIVLVEGVSINERGEIAAQGVLPDGSSHAVLLIPCGAGESGCIDAAAAADHLAPQRIAISRINSHVIHRRDLLDDHYRILRNGHH